MHMSAPEITLPVSITTGGSGQAKRNGVTKTESFSTEYRRLLPNKTLLELGRVYMNVDGMSPPIIKSTDDAICLLCKYMVRQKIALLSDIHSMELGRLRAFFQEETSPKSTWKEMFRVLKKYSGETALGSLVWPVTEWESDEGTTEGHSMYAYDAMGAALRKEIDRIRKKKGRLVEAMKKGKVLMREDLDFMFKQMGKKINLHNKSDGSRISREDVTRTVHHYLPGWPVYNKSNREAWYVYEELCGIRLGRFDTRNEADVLAAKHGARAIVTKGSSRKTMNPGELLLDSISSPARYPAASVFRSLFDSHMEIIDTYYPTAYDWQCVFFYWVWLTGWNVETMASIAPHTLGLDIDIAKHRPLEVFTEEHFEIVGVAPTRPNPPKNQEKSNNAGAVITGHKTRSQPEDNPKECIYVSEKDNPYDLYLVLKDFYELTEPLRRYLMKDEKDCILLGVSRSSVHDKYNRGLTIFGGILHGSAPDYNKNGLGKFFEKNPIYEDEQEFLGRDNDNVDIIAGDHAPLPEKHTRILTTTAMKMRTTWEAKQEANYVPLTQRQIQMGHTKAKTTMTSYGAERSSVGIRKRRLRRILKEIERNIFKGQLKRYEHSTRKTRGNNVVQIFSHLQSDVFVCLNPSEPTWSGHKEYVDGNCTHFDECLFCEQCLITHDTLPVLVRWHRDIKQMVKLVGPLDLADKVFRKRQAIEEVFDLCRKSGGGWRTALEKAAEIEMDPEFTAPSFTYRYPTEA